MYSPDQAILGCYGDEARCEHDGHGPHPDIMWCGVLALSLGESPSLVLGN
jgi:hypothetical protein